MTKPMLNNMRSYSQKTLWEADQEYIASAHLQEVFEQMPMDQALYINLNAPEQEEVCLVVDSNASGARVKVSGRHVYLAMGVLTQEQAHYCFRSAHTQLLKGCWYTLPEEVITQYWSAPDEMLDSGDRPVVAESVQHQRSQFIEQVIRQHCDAPQSIMEIGCHNGAHLNHLQQAFGSEMAGVEINAFAVASMFQNYPNLKPADIRVGELGNVLARLPDGHSDVVFSMATLAHLHPNTSEQVWRDLTRVSARYLITIEQEHLVSDRQWARAYDELFQAAGAKQLHCTSLDDVEGLKGFTLRVFEVVHAEAPAAAQQVPEEETA